MKNYTGCKDLIIQISLNIPCETSAGKNAHEMQGLISPDKRISQQLSPTGVLIVTLRVKNHFHKFLIKQSAFCTSSIQNIYISYIHNLPKYIDNIKLMGVWEI